MRRVAPRGRRSARQGAQKSFGGAEGGPTSATGFRWRRLLTTAADAGRCGTCCHRAISERTRPRIDPRSRRRLRADVEHLCLTSSSAARPRRPRRVFLHELRGVLQARRAPPEGSRSRRASDRARRGISTRACWTHSSSRSAPTVLCPPRVGRDCQLHVPPRRRSSSAPALVLDRRDVYLAAC